MTDKITQEQAVQIAKWLGVEESKEGWLTYNDEFMQGSKDEGFTPSKWETVSYWLYSPEGQSAVMDKLEALCIEKSPDLEVEIGFISWSHFEDAPCWYVCIAEECGVPETTIGRANAKTRQHALLLAVLEMLGGEK